MFVCITNKAETVFTLRISNGLGRSLGHMSEVDANVFGPPALKVNHVYLQSTSGRDIFKG